MGRTGGRWGSTDIKYAVINETAAGAHTLVASVLGKRIRVLAFSITVSAATVLTFTILTGPVPLAANQTWRAVFTENGPFIQATSTALLLVSSNIVVQAGWIVYVED